MSAQPIDRTSSTARQAEAVRRRIRQYMDEGYKPSKIAKLTGESYAHVKQIWDQEKVK